MWWGKKTVTVIYFTKSATALFLAYLTMPFQKLIPLR